MTHFSIGRLLTLILASTIAIVVAPGAGAVAAPLVTSFPHSAAVAAPGPGSFQALTPARVLDTRRGLGAGGPVGAQREITVPVLGRGGVPSAGVAAVAITVTATRTAGVGYLTVFQYGAPRPQASTVNFQGGQNVANLTIVPVGSGGRIALFNGARSNVDMVGDVVGYFLAGNPLVPGSFRSLSQKRLLDTRIGLGVATGAVRGGSAASVRVSGVAGVPAAGVASVVVNLTATGATTPGFLTASAGAAGRRATSSVNFMPGQTVANLVIVPVGIDGQINVFNGASGSVHVLADILGYYLGGTPAGTGVFQAVGQRRILDTRSGLARAGAVRGGTAASLRIDGAAGVPGSGVSAVVMNVTVTNPVTGGYLTAYPDSTALPTTSNVNFATRQTVAALVTVPVGENGSVLLYNGSGGGTDMIADIVGFYSGSSATSCDQVTPDPGGTAVTRWNPVVLCVLGMLGQSAGNVGDVDTMIYYESSGDPNAVNLWDSNAKAGHPSKGLIQVIQPTFDTYRSPALSADLYDPAANLYAGLNYAINTYGSIHNVPGLVSLRNGGGYVGYQVRR